jgi:D-alanyl-lipoteichoic acid acyltransferase DltB (MBOAT superfamily)
MNVPSWQFFVFASIGALAFNLSAAAGWRALVWLVLNLLFVSSFTHDPLALLPLAGFLLLGYLGILAPRSGWRRATPVFIVLILVGFVWLKRYSFVPSSLWLPMTCMTIGLSYVFFRVMHLVIDAGQQDEPMRVSVLDYLNYTLNFTSFVSGPIQRYQDYQRMQTTERLPLTEVDIGQALWRMVLGAFKVLIVSAALHSLQQREIAAMAQGQPFGLHLREGAVIAAIYPLYLFANFSGYTDFVIGAARLFRLRLPENFDRPFTSENFIIFWSRWHITLSQWLRSYVFNPLLLTLMRHNQAVRRGPYLGVLAFFVTFFLVGAWHGQTSEFLFFGLLQGGGVAGNKLYQVVMARRLTPRGYARLAADPLYRAASRGLTFTWFTFTLLWFWSSWSQMRSFLDLLGGGGVLLSWLAILAGATVVLAVPDALRPLLSRWQPVGESRYMRTAAASAMMLAMVASIAVLNLASPEIIYKQF